MQRLCKKVLDGVPQAGYSEKTVTELVSFSSFFVLLPLVSATVASPRPVKLRLTDQVGRTLIPALLFPPRKGVRFLFWE
ncbi:hypothetical protein Pla175_13310 [Pirellulimonas nuda]|uniref:Uncharacterized protein n=1 Tax=Pirellulimonas nuda TaxID=2528009 RepID=A0A518D936_9BACT|nr:hypothetical protein Pla175_13310 [Pirellulimonas nuda]